MSKNDLFNRNMSCQAFPLLGRGLGRGLYLKSVQQTIKPSLVSSLKFANKFFSLQGREKRIAFTLAEVLITLGVIGVVAAMTMPVLIKNYKSIVLRSQFTKAYSSFAQATQKIFMEDFGGVNDFENSSVADLIILYQKHMKKAVKCNRNDLCPKYIFPQSSNNSFSTFIQNNYKTYTNNAISPQCISDAAIVLQDKTFAILDNCNDSAKIMTIDINGWQKSPNKLGHDFFMFQIRNGQLEPMGKSGTVSRFHICSKISTSGDNGRGCTVYALTDKDYFKNLP